MGAARAASQSEWLGARERFEGPWHLLIAHLKAVRLKALLP
jgi:hypothetical protein